MDDLVIFIIMLAVISIGIILEKYICATEIAAAIILGSVLAGIYLGLNPVYIALIAALIPGYKYVLLMTDKPYRASGGLKILWGSLSRYSVYMMLAIGLSLVLAGKKLEYIGAWESEMLYILVVFTALTATLDPRPGLFTWIGDKLKRELSSIENALIKLAYVLGIVLLLTAIWPSYSSAGLLGLMPYTVSLALRRKGHRVLSNIALAVSMVLTIFFLTINTY